MADAAAALRDDCGGGGGTGWGCSKSELPLLELGVVA